MADCVVLNDGTSLILLNDGSSCILLNGVEIEAPDVDAEAPYFPLGKKQIKKQRVELSFETKGTVRARLEAVFEIKGSLKRIVAERIQTQGSLKKTVTESLRVFNEIGRKDYRQRCHNELQTLVLAFLLNELDDRDPI